MRLMVLFFIGSTKSTKSTGIRLMSPLIALNYSNHLPRRKKCIFYTVIFLIHSCSPQGLRGMKRTFSWFSPFDQLIFPSMEKKSRPKYVRSKMTISSNGIFICVTNKITDIIYASLLSLPVYIQAGI